MANLPTVFFLPWFFASQIANAKFLVQVDIAVIIAVDWPRGEPEDRVIKSNIEWVERVADKFTDQFEMGEDKAKMTLINAATARDYTPGFEVWIPLTADEAEFKRNASEWAKTKFIGMIISHYDYAMEVAHTQLSKTKDDNRAKAIFITITEFEMVPAEKTNMTRVSKQLRESGCKIYAMVKEGDSEKMAIAQNITGDRNNVVVFKGITFDNTVADLIPDVSKKIAEGAKGTTGGPTTTTGVAEPTPLLQLLGCLLIGVQLLLRMFTFQPDQL